MEYVQRVSVMSPRYPVLCELIADGRSDLPVSASDGHVQVAAIVPELVGRTRVG
jgi:hypothetical protein